MAASRTFTTTTTTLILTLLLTLSTPVSALSVAKKAAVGISVGFGTLLLVSLGAILYLKCSPTRRAERAANRETQDHVVTDAEAIEFHERENRRNFNIWDYDHQAVMKKKQEIKDRQHAREHGTVETVA